jgi:hypothetical protein
MASQQAENLKETFYKAPAEEFEHLTIKDVSPGQKFIIFPLPGGILKDRYLRANWIYNVIEPITTDDKNKIEESIKRNNREIAYSENETYGSYIGKYSRRNIKLYLPHSVAILKIDTCQ